MLRTRVGYTGGTKDAPTYRSLGDHTESFQVDFDPQRITYDELLELVFESHNPCSRAWSRQYMSAIFFHDDAQKAAVERAVAKFVEDESDLQTVVAPLDRFWLAEDYHQKYRLRSEDLLEQELRAIYPDLHDFVNSTAAMRINAYLAGHGSMAQFERELPLLGLSEQAQTLLRSAR